jgi:Ca-activated chloride channel homolog
MEDGHDETISFFASTDVPFDLVLLLDLSGSTTGKRKLIRESTERFILAARPSDRIAIVTFSGVPKVVTPLTNDRAKLLAGAREISGEGWSNIWDALKFSLADVVGPHTLERRSAVVMMTDGVDSSVFEPSESEANTHVTFADLLETVRETDTLIVPIYLDTESDEPANEFSKRRYVNARKVLATLAEESGGSYYHARKVNDLNGVYQQVINDLGKIYSLGYRSHNDKRDGTWRFVNVQIVNRPDLIAHSRPGYYAK